MDHAEEKDGEGFAHPAASETSLPDVTTLAPATLSGFDNLNAQNAQQTLQATGSIHQTNGTPERVRHAAAAVTMRIQYESIPLELRELDQWVIAAPDKAPWSVDGTRASSTDPTTWSDFYTACTVAEEWGAGIGFMLSAGDGLACIDLDVKDAESHPDKPDLWTTPEELAFYDALIGKFDSYTERSRSGKGFHIWVLGNIGAGAKRGGLEVYSQERFIICTGNMYVNKPVAQRQELLLGLVERIRTMQGTPLQVLEELDAVLTDEVILQRASTAANAEKFNALWAGKWEGEYPSQSEADLSLMSMLTFYSKSNEQCRRLFRMSALGKREKAVKNNYYVDNTLKLIRGRQQADLASVGHGEQIAMAIMASAMQKLMSPKSFKQRGDFRLLLDWDLAQLPTQRWLVKGIIPDASIGSIYGQSGTYKSFLALDLLAHISNGWSWFRRKVVQAPCVYVPFEGQGGIPKRVAAWRTARIKLGHSQPTTNIAFISDRMNLRDAIDRDRLVQTLTKSGWAGGVLCIDTLAQAGAGIDENSSEGMGEMIAIFQDLQQRLGGVVLVIHHSGKVESAGLRGWSGLRGALDFAIKTSLPDDGGALEAEFTLDKVKDGESGWREGFTMVPMHIDWDEDGDSSSSLIVWQGTAKQQQQEKQTTVDADRDAEDDDFVCQWIKTQLSIGNYPSKNSLKKQLNDMKEQRAITQDRVGAATERLLASLRIAKASEKSPTGNAYLIAGEETVAKK